MQKTRPQQTAFIHDCISGKYRESAIVASGSVINGQAGLSPLERAVTFARFAHEMQGFIPVSCSLFTGVNEA